MRSNIRGERNTISRADLERMVEEEKRKAEDFYNTVKEKADFGVDIESWAKLHKELLKASALNGYVTFGVYPQTKEGKDRTPIEWIVLAIENGKILVISRDALDCQQYDSSETETDVTWETCSLRKWLNGTFLNNAFSADEQAKIATTYVSADRNPEYNTDPGNATQDKVFLLSITEAEKYFKTSESRRCAPTAYAYAQGAFPYIIPSGEATCWWWLRSPGNSSGIVANVTFSGTVYDFGDFFDDEDGCVRPALWIDLNSYLD